jgi:hypothetical protein
VLLPLGVNFLFKEICMSKLCSELEAIVGCQTTASGVKTDIVIHYEYRVADTGNRTLHATRYTNAAGVPIVPGGTDVVTPGQCPVAQPDVEFDILCDKLASGVVVEFVRRTVTTFSSTNVPTTTVTNLGLDYVTAYVPAGTVGACNQDCDPVTPVGLVNTWG